MIDTDAGIWSIKMGGIGFIPGQTEKADKNFLYTIYTWAALVLVMSIAGSDYVFGWITNTIALYRLSFWNVSITFAILIAGFIGYLYWIGRCSTYTDATVATKDEVVEKNGFFKLFANELSLAHLIAGILIVGLPTMLSIGSWMAGTLRSNIMLIVGTIVCLLFVGAGFIPVIIGQTDPKKCTQKQQFTLSLIVTLGIFFLSSAYAGSIFLVYLLRLFSQFFSDDIALPKFAQGWTGLVMSLVTMFRNTFYSIFIIIANIFGGLSFFTSN